MKRRLHHCLLLLLWLCSPVSWANAQAKDPASQAKAPAAFSLRLPHPSGGADLRLDGYAFDDRTHSFRVLDEGALQNQRLGGLDAAMRSVGALAGINGGFFGPDSAPLGKMVADGTSTGRLARGSLTSGIIFRSERGLALWRVAEYEQKGSPAARQMLQSGPFLVDAGAEVPGLEATRSRVRSLVLHDQAHGWVIATTSPATLADVARALAKAGTIGGVRTSRVLNLDGGSSSGLWIGGKSLRRPWKPVRNYLAVVPK